MSYVYSLSRKCCNIDEDLFPKAVDTVLVKLYAQFEKTYEPLILLQKLNDALISEVKPMLQVTGDITFCVYYTNNGEKMLSSLSCLNLGQSKVFFLTSFLFGYGLNKITQDNRRSVVGQQHH